MFSHRHYVPALRWKAAERRALEELPSDAREVVTPLIEIPPPALAPSEKHDVESRVIVVAEQLAKAWGAQPFFIDFGLVTNVRTGTGRLAIEVFLSVAAGLGLIAIPVVSNAYSSEFQSAIVSSARRRGCGFGFRVGREEVLGRSPFRRPSALSDSPVDLLVDLGVWDAAVPSLIVTTTSLPNIDTWRSLSVIAGAFPRDLMGMRPGRHEIRREEWCSWRDAMSAWRSGRRPSFGDFTIQYACYHEPPARANVSASIRYAGEDHWVVMRGEGLMNKNGPGWKQYPANAELLCLQDEFCGRDFSYGDRYIWDIGTHQSPRIGSPETWLAAGINHHLVLAARQVRAMSS
jgi:Beta protein